MKNSIFFIIALCMVLLISGCASSNVKKIGTNRYSINAWPGTLVGTANDNFINTARELCPQGFKVIERHGEYHDVYGTIECE